MAEQTKLTTLRFVTCRCHHCNGGIEFDASDFQAGETRPAECPHCHKETIIFLPEQKVPSVISDESIGELKEKQLSKPPDNSGRVDENNLQESINYAKFFNKVQTADAKWQYDLGIAHFRQKDYSEAVKCFTKAAEHGHSEAQCNLGICYMDGLGVAKDETEAVKWIFKAAEQGVAHAEYSLGVAYFFGRDVSKDISVALKWWHRAAEHGHSDAQYNLGICYETATNGDCIPQDYVEAYKWMKLAAAQGYEGAQKKCKELVLKMNAEQIGAVEPADQMLWKHERLTPALFSDFIGQSRVKERLVIAVAAAKKRKEPLDHVLLVGTPSSGKATLANIVAKAMGANIKSTSGPTIEKAGDLAGLLTNLEEGDVLFIEEIHRLQRTIEEYLYPAMTDFQLDLIIDQGDNARSVRLNLPRFTLIGSTTNKERLTPNLLSSFRIIENMDDYSIEELAVIARRFATLIEAEIEADATDRIARSADGTPIDVLNRLQHVRDFAHVKGNEKITLEIAEAALKLLASHDEKQDASESRDAIPSAIRREVWRRDGGKCVKCGSRKNLEYDHIIPVSKGGSNTARNIELLCEAHNRAKHDLIQ